VDLKIIGLKKLDRSLAKKLSKLKAPERFYQQAVLLVDRWIQKNFETEGQKAYPGKGWKPLAPSTMRAREKGWGDYIADPAPKILQNKGWLKGKWKHNWNAREGIVESGVTYGEYHDQGKRILTKQKGKLPQRKITPNEEMIGPEIKKLLAFWVRGVLR
jgi:phage gpG-like protein